MLKSEIKTPVIIELFVLFSVIVENKAIGREGGSDSLTIRKVDQIKFWISY